MYISLVSLNSIEEFTQASIAYRIFHTLNRKKFTMWLIKNWDWCSDLVNLICLDYADDYYEFACVFDFKVWLNSSAVQLSDIWEMSFNMQHVIGHYALNDFNNRYETEMLRTVIDLVKRID